MTDDKVPAKSAKGKEILAYASQSEYCVLEFATTDNGELLVTDITGHHRQLSREAIGQDPGSALDK